jgi:uncharacterized coiled-coil protein SlyX
VWTSLPRGARRRNAPGLLVRVRRFRPFRPGEARGDLTARMEGVETRLAHLEAALEGLQDAVHRDSLRQNKLTAELQHRMEPQELARALSADARRRGI